MIQFNLLPEVKKDYVKAKRTKRLIMTASFFVTVGSVGMVLLLFSIVQVVQKGHISDLTDDIQKEKNSIQGIANLNELLTVQNQLTVLPGLHEAKPKTSRIFIYIPFVSPQEIKVVSLDYDSVSGFITLQGNADTIASVNKFVDNIKATRYSIVGTETDKKLSPFTQVKTQLSGDNDEATFKIEFTYDPVIFDNTKEIVLYLEDQSVSTKIGDDGGQQ